jgi:hypothetical protein
MNAIYRCPPWSCFLILRILRIYITILSTAKVNRKDGLIDENFHFSIGNAPDNGHRKRINPPGALLRQNKSGRGVFVRKDATVLILIGLPLYHRHQDIGRINYLKNTVLSVNSWRRTYRVHCQRSPGSDMAGQHLVGPIRRHIPQGLIHTD